MMEVIFSLPCDEVEFMQGSDLLRDNMAIQWRLKVNTLLGASGVLEFWAGAMPATPDDADTGDLIVSMSLGSNPWQSPTANVSDLTIPSDTDAIDSGTITYYRFKDGSNVCCLQGACGTGGEEVNFDDVNFTVGDTLHITDFSATFTLGGP